MRQSHKIEEVKDRGPKQLKNTDYMNKFYIMSFSLFKIFKNNVRFKIKLLNFHIFKLAIMIKQINCF